MPEMNSKKRKREEDDGSDDSPTRLSLFTSAPSAVGPALVAFPSVKPPEDTSFSCYFSEKDSSVDFATANAILSGETQAIQFTSNNKDKLDPGYACRYLIGIRNKATNQMHIRTAPLFIVGHRVKALDTLNGSSQATQDYTLARNQLGEAFGTKKARAAIRAMERNQVDVGAMAGISDVLQDRIDQKTNLLPKKEEANTVADSNRSIPRYNEDATTPAEVYPLNSIIPESELSAISLDMTSVQALPFKRSSWINTHVTRRSHKPSKTERLELKILFYISCMLYFKRTLFKAIEKSELSEKLSSLPDVIAESLISRFAEATRGSNLVQFTLHKEAELLTHAFALCLRIDHFACDAKVIAADLGMPPAAVQRYFKSLGCVVATPNRAEQLELGIGPEQAMQTKLAILRVPLKFPTASRGRR